MINRILERLEETRWTTNFDAQCLFENAKLDKCIEIVQEVAKEYGKDTNVPSNGWIPVTESIPKDGQRIIATFTDGSVYQVDFKLFLHENPQYAHNHNVIAWQPLPAPYQKGE